MASASAYGSGSGSPSSALPPGREAARREGAVARPRIENDEGLGPGDASPPSQLLDHLAEALHVRHLEPDECIRIARRRENRLHLGELHGRLLDLLQVGGPGK